MNAAIAVFVKTPRLSPVKTRLAAEIGDRPAQQFHQLAVEAVAEIVAGMPGVKPYWAVAELAAVNDPMWDRFSTVAQGDGGLGARLHQVCSTLQLRHGCVLLLGADAPQLTRLLLANALNALDNIRTPFVLGRATDGGFWLFGTRCPVPETVWQTPTYSSDFTADELCTALSPYGEIAPVAALTDVDRADDLASAADALDELAEPTPAQRRIRDWVRRLLATTPESTRA